MTTPSGRGVGLVAACDDPKLLGLNPWPRQRELLASIEGGPRLHVLALGRRSGKTTMSAAVGVWDCLLRPQLDALVRPGERRHSVAVATSQRQARLFVHAAVSLVERSPLLRGMIESTSEDSILFRNRTALSAFPCTARGVRGWPISSLLLDEAAHMVSDTEGPAVAGRVFASLAPASAQFQDHARLLVASTPFGSSGFFADLYEKAASGQLEDARAYQVPTAAMNPTISAEFLLREQARDPDSYRSEYLAEFVGSGGAFLDSEAIADAVVHTGAVDSSDGHGWVAGFDASFASDPAGLAIVGRDRRNPQRLLLGLSTAWKPARHRPESFEERREIEDTLLDEVASTCLAWGVSFVVIDQFFAGPVASHLRRRGLGVRVTPWSAASKSAAFSEVRARLTNRSLVLYDEPLLIAELKRLRAQYRAGSASVISPRTGGSHGDRAAALALAVNALRGGGASENAACVGGVGSLANDLDESRLVPFGDIL